MEYLREKLEILHIDAYLILKTIVFATIIFIYGSRILSWQSLSDNDASYYFGVAKHIAENYQLQEPIIWHYLIDYKSIVHSPFDYWTGGVSLLLVPFFVVFGVSKMTSALAIGIISLLSIYFFYRIITILTDNRYPFVMLFVTLLFALSSSLKTYRFEPDGVVVFQLFMLLTLLYSIKKQYATACIMSYLTIFFRSDGLIFFIITYAGLVCWIMYNKESRKTILFQSFLTFSLLSLYFLITYSLHGSIVPSAAKHAPFLKNYVDLYVYGEKSYLTTSELIQKFVSLRYLEDRLDLLHKAFMSVWDFKKLINIYVFSAFSFMLFIIKKKYMPAGLLVFFFLYSSMLAYLQNLVFAYHRTLFILIPIIYIIITFTLITVIELAAIKPIYIYFFCVTSLVVFIALDMFQYSLKGNRNALMIESALQELDTKIKKKNILADHPFWIIANSSNYAISYPQNGLDSVYQLLIKYDIDYVVIIHPEKEFKSIDDIAEAFKRKNNFTIHDIILQYQETIQGVHIAKVIHRDTPVLLHAAN